MTLVLVSMLLYAFQDPRKEWGDSNIQIFFTELTIPHHVNWSRLDS